MTQETVATEVVEAPVESDSSFSDGFDQARGTPAVKPEVKAEAPKAEVKAEAPKEEKAPEPDPVKAQLDSITQSLAQLSGSFGQIDQRFKSFEGRIHKVTATVDEIRTAGKAAIAAAPAPEKKALADKVDAQLTQVKVDFPEMADLVAAAREQLRAEMPKAFDPEEIKKAVSERLAEAEAKTATQVAQARVLAAIDLKHDGWETTINTPEFEAWYGKQAPDVQALSASPKAAAAIQMLDLYTADAEKAKQAQEDKQANDAKLARAIAPKGVVGTAAPTQTEDEALDAGFKSVRGR